MLWRVYIDEAGDRGISAKSSAHFVTTAIAIRDRDEQQARAELAELRRSLGRQPEQTLHFQRFTHSQRLKAAQDLAGVVRSFGLQRGPVQARIPRAGTR